MTLQFHQRDPLSLGRQGWEGFLEEESLRDLSKPGVNPRKRQEESLVKGEAGGEPVLEEAPRLEVQGLVLEPATEQCWSGRWAWDLTPPTMYQNKFELSELLAGLW